eukprot:407545-Heterocapsa_arctica.AAC.1
MGAWAHGRSSSFHLNGLLRHHIPWAALGRKEQCHLHLSSGDNPSDDPSRKVLLRAPDRPEPWMASLLKPQSMRSQRRRVHHFRR